MRFNRIVLIVLVLNLTGCKTPPVPPEIKLADEQEQKLWRAGASVYTPVEYEKYRSEIQRVRRTFESEKLKLGWFRRYDSLQEEYRRVLISGDALLSRIRAAKESEWASFRAEAAALESRVERLKEITLKVNERGRARRCLSKAEILLKEASLMAGQEKAKEATGKLVSVREALKEAENACLALLGRYRDRQQVQAWRKMAAATIEESRTKGLTAIIVSKLDKKLIVYKRGKVIAEYEIGLGLNGLSDKLHSGDNATPEGRYKIIKKNASSRYYKALMIDYPNEEDLRRFSAAKQKREIPYWVGIGGLVEIHGGGKDSLTRGCLSVDDQIMDQLFDMVAVGTPITIVGTLDGDNLIFRDIQDQ